MLTTPGGVEVRFIDLKDAVDPAGPVARVFTEILPQVLATRQFVPARIRLCLVRGWIRSRRLWIASCRGFQPRKWSCHSDGLESCCN